MDIFSVLYVVILIISIVLHEVAHGYTADRLGDPTARLQGRLSLNPMVHIDWIGSVAIPAFLILTGSPFVFGWAKPVPFNPYNFKNPRWGGALVAVMGPVTNLVIALIAAIILSLLPQQSLSVFVIYLLQGTIITNIALAVFNLIPVPPLDGHHILFALIPNRYYELKQRLIRLSLPLIIVVIVFGGRFISPIIMTVYNWFIF